MESEKTTDLKTIRRSPKRFAWGKVIQILDVGPDYTIVVYDHEDKTQYHPYVGGEDTCTSCDTLDEALIIAMAESHKVATGMARAAAKLLLDL